MSKKIVFKINKDGNVIIDKVEGYGSSCLDATKLLERKIGLADESTRKLTSEYEELPPVSVGENIRH